MQTGRAEAGTDRSERPILSTATGKDSANSREEQDNVRLAERTGPRNPGTGAAAGRWSKANIYEELFGSGLDFGGAINQSRDKLSTRNAHLGGGGTILYSVRAIRMFVWSYV